MKNDGTDYMGVDLHCDALQSVQNGASLAGRRKNGHFDIERMAEGGIWCQVLSLFVAPKPGTSAFWWRSVQKMLVRFRQALDAAHDKWTQATTQNQVMQNYGRGLRSLILEIEGLHPIEKNPKRLDELWNAGVRIFTLTWNNSNEFATSAMDAKHGDGGLKPAGKSFVKQVSKMGGIIDLSHASDGTFYDVLEMGISPMLSHSCVREIKDNRRNATKDMIAKLATAGGVIGVNFFPGFLSAKRYGQVCCDDIVDHIEAIIEAGGENVPAIGSDFDGVNALPKDIPDASAFMKVAECMVQRKFPEQVIKKVMGMNFIEYFKKRNGKNV